MVLHIYTQGRFNNHTACSLYMIMVTATGVVGRMKMGNIVARAGLKPTSLAVRANVLPLHHVGSLLSPLYPCPPVYVTPYLRVQCRLLQIYIINIVVPHLHGRPPGHGHVRPNEFPRVPAK